MQKPIMIWGTADTGKARVRIMMDALREHSTIRHHAIWQSVRDKSQLSMFGWFRRLIRMLLAYPILLWRYLLPSRHRRVIIGYPGALDVLILWPFAKIRGAHIVWDMFTSAYDTLVHDRKRFSPHHPASYLVYTLEWLACRAADRVVLDTKTHATRMAQLFEAKPDKFTAIPVGCSAIFQPQESTRDRDRFRVLFVGQFIPLHGIQTILDAMTLCQDESIEWRIVGSGQDDELLEHWLSDNPKKPVEWTRWLPYEALPKAINDADCCLGIFGTSDKAASVIPNKIYEALACGKPSITRDSPAIRELPDEALQAVTLIPPANPHALLDAVLALKNNPKPVHAFASNEWAKEAWRKLIPTRPTG